MNEEYKQWIKQGKIDYEKRMNTYTDETIALAMHLGLYDVEDVCLNEEDDYLILTDDDANIELFARVTDDLWLFNPSFLAGETGLDEDVFKALQANGEGESLCKNIRSLIDTTCGIDEFVTAASDADGRGHFLAPYDGEEHEVTVQRGPNEKAETYYIYRVN